MTCPVTLSIGVYALGAADPAQQRRVETHLAGCPECRAELARLAPLGSLLARVPAELVTGGQPFRPGRPRRHPALVRLAWVRLAWVRLAWVRRRGMRGVRAAASLAAAAAAGAAGGFWLAPGTAGQPPPAAVRSAGNPATHVAASAALTPASWGTSIRLTIRGAPRNVECRLVVRNRSGQAEVSGTWAAWRPGPVTVPASVDWRASEITSIQVVTAHGVLVTIPVTGPATQRGPA